MDEPIFAVIRNKNKAIVEEEIASGKYNLNAVNSNGYSPILLAAIDGDHFLVESLVRGGASFTDKHRPIGVSWDPLHLAARKGHASVVNTLVKFGANVDAKDYKGNTPLACALLAGHSQVAQLLIESGAQTNLTESVVNLALKSLSVDLIAKMISFGYGLQSVEDGTALHYLIRRDAEECCYAGHNSRKFITVFDYLLKENLVDVNQEFADRGTPLTFAFTNRRHHFTSRLIKHGVDVTKCSLRQFRFSSDATLSLKYLFFAGFRFDLNSFREKCSPLTPKNHFLRRELDIVCRSPSCGWFTDEEFKNESKCFQEFCVWLDKQSNTPFSLQQIARIVIRKTFGVLIHQYLNETKTPESIQKFLFYNDVT